MGYIGEKDQLREVVLERWDLAGPDVMTEWPAGELPEPVPARPAPVPASVPA